MFPVQPCEDRLTEVRRAVPGRAIRSVPHAAATTPYRRTKDRPRIATRSDAPCLAGPGRAGMILATVAGGCAIHLRRAGAFAGSVANFLD